MEKCMIEDLYKGKYLIACYDKDGFLIDVANKPSQITVYKKEQIECICSRILQGKEHKFVKLIDCLEIHNDLFEEEDRIFIEFMKSLPHKKTNAILAKELGISVRTLYRRKNLK